MFNSHAEINAAGGGGGDQTRSLLISRTGKRPDRATRSVRRSGRVNFGPWFHPTTIHHSRSVKSPFPDAKTNFNTFRQSHSSIRTSRKRWPDPKPNLSPLACFWIRPANIWPIPANIDRLEGRISRQRTILSLSLSLLKFRLFSDSLLFHLFRSCVQYGSLSLSLFPFPWLVCRAANSLWKLHRVPELVNETATIKRDTLVEAQRGNG